MNKRSDWKLAMLNMSKGPITGATNIPPIGKSGCPLRAEGRTVTATNNSNNNLYNVAPQEYTVLIWLGLGEHPRFGASCG